MAVTPNKIVKNPIINIPAASQTIDTSYYVATENDSTKNYINELQNGITTYCDSSWCTVSLKAPATDYINTCKKISIAVSANTGTTERNARIYARLNSVNSTQFIQIKQDGKQAAPLQVYKNNTWTDWNTDTPIQIVIDGTTGDIISDQSNCIFRYNKDTNINFYKFNTSDYMRNNDTAWEDPENVYIPPMLASGRPIVNVFEITQYESEGVQIQRISSYTWMDATYQSESINAAVIYTGTNPIQVIKFKFKSTGSIRYYVHLKNNPSYSTNLKYPYLGISIYVNDNSDPNNGSPYTQPPAITTQVCFLDANKTQISKQFEFQNGNSGSSPGYIYSVNAIDYNDFYSGKSKNDVAYVKLMYVNGNFAIGTNSIECPVVN